MFIAFFIIFFSIFIALIGDKTQILTVLLATKTKKHFLLFCGVMTGYVFSVSLAVVAGLQIQEAIPRQLLHFLSACLFILLGIILLYSRKKIMKKYHKLHLKNPFYSSMSLIFLADLGDKTQISIALFAANYPPVIVFISSLLSLAAGSFLVIYLARLINKWVKPSLVETIAGIIFICIGILLFFT